MATTNIEETFRNYVSNLSNDQTFRTPISRSPASSVLPLRMPAPQPQPSMGSKIWQIVKKWLGFVVFLIVAGVVGVVLWRRWQNSKKPVQDAGHCPNRQFVHDGDLEQEYLDDEEGVVDGAEVVYDQEELEMIPESDEMDESDSEDVNAQVKAFVERETAKQLEKIKEDEEEEDDFEKMKKVELQKLRNEENTRKTHHSLTRAAPASASKPGNFAAKMGEKEVPGGEEDDEDFDPIDTLHNA